MSGGQLLLTNGTNPSTPSSGKVSVFSSSTDKLLYYIDDAGVVRGPLLYNKPRTLAAASYTTDTGTSIDMDSLEMFVVTAQAGALKFNNPLGTLGNGQVLLVRIKDNGSARALTYDTKYRAMGTALPSTTVLSKTLYLGFIYNSTDDFWDLVGAAQQA